MPPPRRKETCCCTRLLRASAVSPAAAFAFATASWRAWREEPGPSGASSRALASSGSAATPSSSSARRVSTLALISPSTLSWGKM